MQKAIPTPPWMLFYCTNRLLAGGRNILLRLRRAEHLEAHHPATWRGETQKRKLGKTNL
jgi:hypothetical protein